jgi:hypothetical protein
LLDVEPLLSLFGTIFDLPISWPKQTSSFATFAWVHVGNTELELWASASNSDLPLNSQPPLILGFALEPIDLMASIADLAEEGIQCKSPQPYQTQSVSGALVTNFTNSVVLDLSSASCCIFFCDWDPDGTIFPWTGRLTAGARRSRDQKELLKRNGGTLGLVGLSEIELATPTLLATAEKWKVFTGSEKCPVALTSDIDLHLVAGATHSIQSLTFDVQSLEVAKAFLMSKNLLGESSAGMLTLAAHAADGQTIRFKESASIHATQSESESESAISGAN